MAAGRVRLPRLLNGHARRRRLLLWAFRILFRAPFVDARLLYWRMRRGGGRGRRLLRTILCPVFVGCGWVGDDEQQWCVSRPPALAPPIGPHSPSARRRSRGGVGLRVPPFSFLFSAHLASFASVPPSPPFALPRGRVLLFLWRTAPPCLFLPTHPPLPHPHDMGRPIPRALFPPFLPPPRLPRFLRPHKRRPCKGTQGPTVAWTRARPTPPLTHPAHPQTDRDVPQDCPLGGLGGHGLCPASPARRPSHL